jgi:hypothetical protein
MSFSNMAISSFSGGLDMQATSGWIGKKPTKTIYQYNQVGDRVEECKEVIVHTFKMDDVEDPDLYAAEPLWNWQQSDIGKWIMEHAAESPKWHRHADPYNYGYVFQVHAKLTGPALTEWFLRYGNKPSSD